MNFTIEYQYPKLFSEKAFQLRSTQFVFLLFFWFHEMVNFVVLSYFKEVINAVMMLIIHELEKTQVYYSEQSVPPSSLLNHIQTI